MCSLILFHNGKPLTFEAETNAELMTNLHCWLVQNRKGLDGGVTLLCEHEAVTLQRQRGTWFLYWGHQKVRSRWVTAEEIFAQACEYEIDYGKEFLR